MATSDFLVWGNNQSCLLAKSSSKCLPTPTPLNIGYEVISMCSSEKHISFLTKEGYVFSYGVNLDGRLGVSTKSVDKVGYDAPVKVPIRERVIRIQSGFSHMCALTETGDLYSWGLGDYGALGTGQFKSRSIPTKVQLPKDALASLRQISCGAMHTAFLTDLGEVYTCGSNQYGELGVNKPQKISTPIPIAFHQQVQQVSCGVFYTLLLTKDGKVYGMGNNKYGQLGIGHKVNQSHPTIIRDLEGIVKVSAGYHSGAIDCYGNLYIWGSGSFGEQLKPMKFVLSVPIRDLAIRGFFGLAIGHTSKNENRVYTWGNNTFGELGIGNYDAAKEPVEVDRLRGVNISKIVLGVNFAMVLMIEDLQAKRWASDEYLKIADEHYNKQYQRYPRQTDRKSIIGFEQKYLNSHKKGEEAVHRNRSYEKEYRNQSPVPVRTTSQQYYQKEQVHSPNPSSRDYQKLFVNLSKDYQKLVTKYTVLEKELQTVTDINKDHRYREETFRNGDYSHDEGLKEQLAKVNYQIIALKEDLSFKNRRIEDQRLQIQLLQKTAATSTNRNQQLSHDLESEYNKLLNQKEQLINKLTLALTKLEDESRASLTALQTERNDLFSQLQIDKSSTAKIVKEHQNLIDQIQSQLKRVEQKARVYEEENMMLKKKFQGLEEDWKAIETYRIKMEEQSQTERIMRQRFQNQLKESEVKKELMSERIDELEMQLTYEKEFNRKYEGSMAEINDLKEKLHKELTLQLDINKEKDNKIDSLKADVEKYKKYKKELDEKNIIIQQHNQNFENYKRKINEIIGQKEDQIEGLTEQIDLKGKEFQSRLIQKDQTIEDLSKDVNRLEKQTNKNKQNITALKQQINLKEDEIEHLGQQRNALDKKVTYLQTQLNKEIQEREELIADLGDVKRELTKLKISYGELENKYVIEKEQKEKVQKIVVIKDQELRVLKDEFSRMQQKCENLKKQNNMYRMELEETNAKLQEQEKINTALTEANKEFAQNEEEFNQKIKSLEARVYELEDENKSYIPRYEALMQRNKELDQRNREMAEMINKAIEIQAENYKTTILKEVQINTDNFLNQVKEEQEFKSKERRNKKQSKTLSKFEQKNEEQFQSPPDSMAKEEPYTKVMKERISAHKRRVSESANKLASLLDIDEGRQTLGIDSRRTEDLEKLNSQMESFNAQKEEFMSKIHSFAEKLKIL